MSEVLKNLNIRKFASKQGYESATVGDNDLCVVLNDGEPALKTSTMPTASASELGNIYQYTGTTSGTFVHGYFYECVLNSSTYEWQQVNVQPAPVVTDQPNTRIYKRFDNVSRAMNTILLYPVLRTTDGATAYTGQYEGESVIHLRAYQGLGDLVIGLTRKGGYDVEQRIYKATGVFSSIKAYLMTDPQNPNTSKIIVLQTLSGYGFYNSLGDNHPIYAWYSFYGTDDSTSYDLGLEWVEPTRVVTEIPEYKPIQVESFDNMGTPNFLGHIVQYVGETDGGYTNGYFYRLDGSIEEEPAELYCNVTTGQEIEVTCTDPDGLISWLASQTGLTEKTVQSTLLDEEFEYTASATPTFTWAGETLDASQFNTYFSFSTQPATDDTITWTTPSGYRRAVEYVDGSWTQVDVQPVTKVNTTVTLYSANWSSNTQTISIAGITADGVVLVSPPPANQSAYTNAGISCTAQAADSLTFTCDTVPSTDIPVTVVML